MKNTIIYFALILVNCSPAQMYKRCIYPSNFYPIHMTMNGNNLCRFSNFCIINSSDFHTRTINVNSDSLKIYYGYGLIDSTLVYHKKLTANDIGFIDSLKNSILKIPFGTYTKKHVSDCSLTCIYLDNDSIECNCCEISDIQTIDEKLSNYFKDIDKIAETIKSNWISISLNKNKSTFRNTKTEYHGKKGDAHGCPQTMYKTSTPTVGGHPIEYL